MNTLITISREFGSGGRELGRRLSELLNIAYYDQEIITEISSAPIWLSDISSRSSSKAIPAFPSILAAVFIHCRIRFMSRDRLLCWSRTGSSVKWQKGQAV